MLILKVIVVVFLGNLLTACEESHSQNSDNPNQTEAELINQPVLSEPPPNENPSEQLTPAPLQPVNQARFELQQSTPADNSTDRALVSRIEMIFSQPLMLQTVTSQTVQLRQASQQVAAQVSSSGRSIVIRPERRLEPSTAYTVSLDAAIMSTQGASLSPVEWQFQTTKNVGATPQRVMDQCMSSADIDMLHAVNLARTQGYQCGSTNRPAVAPIQWQCQLDQAATGHSQDMARVQNMSHVGSDGSSVADRINRVNYGWRYLAENVAFGATSVGSVMNLWLNSNGHCNNIMSPEVREMGAAGARAANNRLYWTQNFAAPR